MLPILPTPPLLAPLCLFAALAPVNAQAKVLSGAHQTEHLELRYRPGSRAAASVPRTAAMAERDLADICRRLEFEPEVRFRLFLYDNVAELSLLTRTTGNAGFSAGRDSHLPYANDQTRYHEMVHLVAAQMPKAGDEPRNLFFAEGLANALLEYVHGVHVHAVAAYYLSAKKLPPLREMTRAKDFYAWLRARPGLNAYDIGASWMRFVLDRFGTKKALRYYHGVPAKQAFGKSEEVIEREWRGMLAKYELLPEVRTLLARRDGQAARFTVVGSVEERLPAELRDAAEWSVLLARQPKTLPESWRWQEGALHGGSKTTDWSICDLADRARGGSPEGPFAFRVKVRVEAGTVGVRIDLDPTRQVLLTNAGTFLWSGDRIATAERAETISGRKVVDLVLTWRADVLTAWVDGTKVSSVAAPRAALAPRVAVAGGRAEFLSARVRGLE